MKWKKYLRLSISDRERVGLTWKTEWTWRNMISASQKCFSTSSQVLTVSSHIDRRPRYLSVGQRRRREQHGTEPYRPAYRTHFTGGLGSRHFPSFQSIVRLKVIFGRLPHVPSLHFAFVRHVSPAIALFPSVQCHGRRISVAIRSSRYQRRFLSTRLMAGIFISIPIWNRLAGRSKGIITGKACCGPVRACIDPEANVPAKSSASFRGPILQLSRFTLIIERVGETRKDRDFLGGFPENHTLAPGLIRDSVKESSKEEFH